MPCCARQCRFPGVFFRVPNNVIMSSCRKMLRILFGLMTLFGTRGRRYWQGLVWWVWLLVFAGPTLLLVLCCCYRCYVHRVRKEKEADFILSRPRAVLNTPNMQFVVPGHGHDEQSFRLRESKTNTTITPDVGGLLQYVESQINIAPFFQMCKWCNKNLGLRCVCHPAPLQQVLDGKHASSPVLNRFKRSKRFKRRFVHFIYPFICQVPEKGGLGIRPQRCNAQDHADKPGRSTAGSGGGARPSDAGTTPLVRATTTLLATLCFTRGSFDYQVYSKTRKW